MAPVRRDKVAEAVAAVLIGLAVVIVVVLALILTDWMQTR